MNFQEYLNGIISEDILYAWRNYDDRRNLVSSQMTNEDLTGDEVRFITLAIQASNAAAELENAHAKFIEHAENMGLKVEH